MNQSKNITRSQIVKAGKILKQDDPAPKDFSNAMQILSYWREQHAEPLEYVTNILNVQSVKKESGVILAKRLKRHESIANKLKRFKTMQLTTMHDIGGCRAIFNNLKNLDKAYRALKDNSSIKITNTRDYIKKPKPDGYRSLHLDVCIEKESKKYIEIQLRSKIQHFWATAVEIVDIYTHQNLKSDLGSKDWKQFFMELSNGLSFLDNIHIFDSLDENKKRDAIIQKIDSTNIDNLKQIYIGSHKLSVKQKINLYSIATNDALKVNNLNDEMGYFLLDLDLKENKISQTYYKEINTALAVNELMINEINHLGNRERIFALVSSGKINDLKSAYPNYFGDVKDIKRYISYLEAIYEEVSPISAWGIKKTYGIVNIFR